MKIFKSHFWYTKSQRNGVLFLVLLIISLQVIYVFADFSETAIDINTAELSAFQKQIDSLKTVKKANKKFKIYPFNPNYITDYKGYSLGMTVAEIDRLHQFRNQNKFVNSKSDFQKVTKINDTLLKKIAPYFKFPAWVSKRNQKKNNNLNKRTAANKVAVSTNDINLATAEDFATISGIGEKLSKRIIKYRSKLQGFSFSDQLYEVWNIDPKLIKELLQIFRITTKPVIKKININTASFKEVLKTPYVDYDLCRKIFDYRDEVAELQNISELKNIAGFPVYKYERIVLYLIAN